MTTINYKNGKIYKIEPICEHDEGDVYIGSTTKQYLSQRMTAHRDNYKRYKNGKHSKTTSFDLFDKYGVENCKSVLLELVEANSKDELHIREAYYIKTLMCVNKNIPMRTDKEYQEDNKEKLKQYRKDNKEKILEHVNKWTESNQLKVIGYREKHYDINKEFRNEKHLCQCGKYYTIQHKLRHEQTTKHQKYCLTI